ncbi:dihydrofolate reductase family protein [Microbacterium invictum]|uniref:Dihydrofolate reductase n=1 Tax=Microbacterium invictum TaxID=515415 RepID=A0AA40VM14_9MICO|nr:MULTISPECIES: dihydrofolate reductase family protein [Microbacterium]MBB4139936.1 dihydrofolate reductase [Microbacterium invictum]
MGVLRYSINVTIDGCVDHREGYVDAESHQHAEETIARADALLLGRVTYQMMEDAWRPPASDAMPDWAKPFGRTIDAAKKYVVSSTLHTVDWNAELVEGDLAEAVRALTATMDLYVGGVTLPTALAALDLIDEYEFVVHPRIAGHGPRLLDGLGSAIDLVATGRTDLRSGLVVNSYVPRSRT